jgi:hypothetical protein
MRHTIGSQKVPGIVVRVRVRAHTHTHTKSKLLYGWQSVSMSWFRAHSGTCDQILLSVWRFLSESCCLFSLGRPLWREDGSADCSAITQWYESHRTRNHTLLSHLRLTDTRTCSIDPVVFGSTGGRLLLESSSVRSSHSIWCPPWVLNVSPFFLASNFIVTSRYLYSIILKLGSHLRSPHWYILVHSVQRFH